MPLMSGLEATTLIRKANFCRPIIVAVTANAMNGDREKCIDSGMDDYLAKPFKIVNVKSMLDKYFCDVGEHLL